MIWTAHPLAQLRHARFVRRRLAERASGIRTAVRTAPAGSIVLAGNSHAEFLGTPNFGGLPSINLGIGGSTAADCVRLLTGLRPDARANAAILFVGTNDVLRWRRPNRPATAERFTEDVAGILRTLERWAPQVFIAAIPPVGPGANGRDPAAIAVFSDRLQELCWRGGHTFFDPFAALRDGNTGRALGGLHPDGVHLADYDGLAAEVVRFVGLRLALSRAGAARHAVASAILSREERPPVRPRTFSAALRAAGRPLPALAAPGPRS